jgi:Na+-transporting methylmalonyl-CoA/oxaloacetate decarboxylase beta subunit
MSLILLPAIIVYIGLILLWLIAEQKWSKRIRITIGLVVLILSLPLPILFTTVITQLDTNSYYAAAVGTLLDETIEALETEDEGFLQRLKAFREFQRLTYESRSDLLENARAFRDDGKKIRNQDRTR